MIPNQTCCTRTKWCWCKTSAEATNEKDAYIICQERRAYPEDEEEDCYKKPLFAFSKSIMKTTNSNHRIWNETMNLSNQRSIRKKPWIHLEDESRINPPSFQSSQPRRRSSVLFVRKIACNAFNRNNIILLTIISYKNNLWNTLY